MNNRINVAILGAGTIANSMAKAVQGIPDEACLYAVASRSLDKAKDFAQKWNIPIAYGSYEELAADKNVDLVYIATPHSEHFRTASLCIENGRNCLVEKPFCVNKNQAEKLFSLAKAKNVLVTEAMWTRYQPVRNTIRNILESGILGSITHIEANCSFDGRFSERLTRPELAGGALLDVGIYTLTVPSMYWGNDVEKIEAVCTKNEYGVDETSDVVLTYSHSRTVHAVSSIGSEQNLNYAQIEGDKATLSWNNLFCPEALTITDNSGILLKEIKVPVLVNGYEYEVLECRKAILDGQKEISIHPHSEILNMMGWMDEIRSKLGIIYPFEQDK